MDELVEALREALVELEATEDPATRELAANVRQMLAKWDSDIPNRLSRTTPAQTL